MKRIMLVVLVLAGLLVLTAACGLRNRDKGVLLGAGAGAAAGGAIGTATGSTARGAINGAVVGGVAGGVIGQQMDQQARELSYELPGATVTRIGEGIMVIFPSGLLFALDSYAIGPGARDHLEKFAASLVKYPGTNSLIVGHTDVAGMHQYNQSLSERRAQSAVAFLASRGIESSRMRTAGRGSSESIATNETVAGRQQNRRLEIAIYADEAFQRQGQSTK